MLTVVKPVSQKRATDTRYGNVQTFLERLLVEVVAGNYRHFLHERVAFGAEPERPEELCWPPLLAMERQVSGLFSSALSSVCPVSRPEESIYRERPSKRKNGKATQVAGRIDFAALYGSRHIGLEVKRVAISSRSGTKERTKERKVLAGRWKVVDDQAATALGHMKEYKAEYHHPVTIGLIVIRVSETVTSAKTVEDVRDAAGERLKRVVQDVDKSMVPKPDFVAHYVPPPEMQAFFGDWGRGDQHRVFPGVIFAATVHGNLPSAAKKKASAPKKPAPGKRRPRSSPAKKTAA